MKNIHFLLAADAPEVGPSAEQGFMQTLLMIGVALVLFYLILWRPEQKRRKAEEAKRSSLKKGDRVTTVAGIIGIVSKVNADTVIVRMIDGAKIEFVKAAIADVQPVSDEEAKKLGTDE